MKEKTLKKCKECKYYQKDQITNEYFCFNPNVKESVGFNPVAYPEDICRLLKPPTQKHPWANI